MPSLLPPSLPLIDDFIAPPCDEAIHILYQDEHILLINKPSGLLSLSGKHPQNWDSVHYRLQHGRLLEGRLQHEHLVPEPLVNGATSVAAAFPEAKLPHRLDLGTSGLMLVALTAAAASSLNKQFQAGTIQKRYFAMLEGWLADDQGHISGAIAKDAMLFPRVKICAVSGKASISEYQV